MTDTEWLKKLSRAGGREGDIQREREREREREKGERMVSNNFDAMGDGSDKGNVGKVGKISN